MNEPAVQDFRVGSLRYPRDPRSFGLFKQQKVSESSKKSRLVNTDNLPNSPIRQALRFKSTPVRVRTPLSTFIRTFLVVLVGGPARGARRAIEVPASEEEWTVIATALTSLATLKALLATTDGHIEGCTFCPIHSPEPIGDILTEFHIYVGAFVSLSEEHGFLRFTPWFLRHFGYLAKAGVKVICPLAPAEPKVPRKTRPEQKKRLGVLLDKTNMPLASSSASVSTTPGSRKVSDETQGPVGKASAHQVGHSFVSPRPRLFRFKFPPSCVAPGRFTLRRF
ncbi:hypothetical protein DFH06DRAFT_1349197 [Mycena polygramma]|nr:hypothetical protein DFH06DRAFT_1349197 [Mycena polygramma]